jgi:hypothetical protein
MLPEIPPSTTLSRQESEKDQDHRRILAYKWYKHYAKPTRANMYSIVDFYANLDCHDNDTAITRKDVDLLQWNTKETEVITKAITEAITEAMKSKKAKKKDKKEKKNAEETEATNEAMKLKPPKKTEVIKEAIKLKSPKKKSKSPKKRTEKTVEKKDQKAEAAHASPTSVISSTPGTWPIHCFMDDW